MVVTTGMLSSIRDDWETPPELFRELDKEFHFTLDPCATEATAKCGTYFTPETDGLTQSWAGHRVFVNPPYGRQLGEWVAKAHAEAEEGALVVMLIPARTDTRYFHDYIHGIAEVRFLLGRIYFYQDGVPGGRAPFPSVVVIFRPGHSNDEEQH